MLVKICQKFKAQALVSRMPVRVLTNADARPHTCANKMERFYKQYKIISFTKSTIFIETHDLWHTR